MIDLKKLRENLEFYKKSTENKQVKIDWDKFIDLDEKVRKYKQQIDNLNNQRNKLSKEIELMKKNNQSTENIVDTVKKIKIEIDNLENENLILEKQYNEIILKIPNPIHESVPIWKDDTENVVIEYVWKKPNFEFQPLTHWEILEKRWMLDQQRSAKVSWARFFYLRDWIVRLQMSLVNFVMDKLYKKWFSLTLVPDMVREDAMIATWFFPADKNEIYSINQDDDNLFLIWTSEVSLVAQHMDELIDVNNLPLRYAWYSPCFRREAWTYWKDMKWILRVHQFEKVEMVSFVKPEDSLKEHEFLLSIEEEIYKELWIHYQKLNICSWDLWAPAAKKYDLEAWFPWQWAYREITSCSNCTDFQARRAKIKYKNWDIKEYVHTLNWTALSMRPLIAIVENYQTKDLRIKIPNILKKYLWDEFI